MCGFRCRSVGGEYDFCGRRSGKPTKYLAAYLAIDSGLEGRGGRSRHRQTTSCSGVLFWDVIQQRHPYRKSGVAQPQTILDPAGSIQRGQGPRPLHRRRQLVACRQRSDGRYHCGTLILRWPALPRAIRGSLCFFFLSVVLFQALSCLLAHVYVYGVACFTSRTAGPSP